MKLPTYTKDWPEPWQHAFQERVSIMEDSRVPDAERKAEEDTRRCAGKLGMVEVRG